MRYLFLLLFLATTFALNAQNNEPWLKFVDPKTRLVGYKDASGEIRIPAKFENYSVADTFHSIIAVREPVGRGYAAYYLMKDGVKAGIDSLYLYDGYDCESEEMILYQDHKTTYVGYLSKNGNPVTPAVYNTATGFKNGFAQALVQARKRCWEASDDTTNCDHLIWDGGTQVLINPKNEILAKGLSTDFYQAVDRYSVLVNKVPEDTSIYVKVNGENGNTYYFVHMEKEFKKWFSTEFMASLETDKSKYLFPEMLMWNEKQGWHSLSKEDYLKKYSGILVKERFATNANKKMSYAQGEFTDYVMKTPIYRRFYTACGKFDKYQYPLYLAKFTFYQKDGKFDRSESFGFIRTRQGYRLVDSPSK